MNCWEFMKCGRTPGGEKVDELGVCPAYPGFGKCCAKVAGTLCGGQIQGPAASKTCNCKNCEFYKSPNHIK